MLEIGTKVKIINPQYARGLIGYILMAESTSRWLIEIEQEEHISDVSEQKNKSLVLSLEESDFEVLS